MQTIAQMQKILYNANVDIMLYGTAAGLNLAHILDASGTWYYRA